MNVYFDTAATSVKKPEKVYAAIEGFFRSVGASPGRSVHPLGIEAGRIVEGLREKIAVLFGMQRAMQVVFTLNCTEALNLALKGLLQEGDHVVTTSVEHNSVMRPLSFLVEERRITVTKVQADKYGLVDPASVREALTDDTALLVMTHASNVTGAIQPVSECGAFAREKGIPFLVDGAQTAGIVPLNLTGSNIDLFAFSGHKGLLGPQGTGGLCIGDGIDLVPLKHGGTGSRSSSETQPSFLPDRLESGTPNTPGLAGLSAAVDSIQERGVAELWEHLQHLSRRMLDGFSALAEVTLYGPRDPAFTTGAFSFTIRGRDPAETASALLEKFGVMTRVGLHCAPSAHKTIGTFPDGTVRASISTFTGEREIDYFFESLKAVSTQ